MEFGSVSNTSELITPVWSQSSMAVTVILSCITGFALWIYQKHCDGLPGIPGPRPYPIIGNVFEMFQCEAVSLLRSWTQIYGKILQYKVFLLGTQVLVTDADALHRVLVSNSANYVKPETLLVPCRVMFGPRCLICLPPQDHDDCRFIINPAFRTPSVRRMASTIAEKAHILVQQWVEAVSSGNPAGSGTHVKVQKGITFLSLDILGACVFGYEFSSLTNPDGELGKALHRILSIQTFNGLRFLPLYKHLPTQLNKDTALLKNLVQDVLKKKLNTLHDDERDGKTSTRKNADMLEILLQSRSETEGRPLAARRQGVPGGTDFTNNQRSPPATRKPSTLVLPDSDIVDDIQQFLIAGHETVTNTLCFALLQLATHPDVQERVREEILREFPLTQIPKATQCSDCTGEQGDDHDDRSKKASEWYFNACQRLVYTECVVKETMRMFPAVPLTLRQSVGEDELGGYKIPPNTVIALHLGTLMRLPEYFSEPDKFLPHRFLQNSDPNKGETVTSDCSESKHDAPLQNKLPEPAVTAKAYLPYLAGPEMCIGHRFAMVEMKIILALILCRFKVEPIAGRQFAGKQGLTYHVYPALELNLIPLQHENPGDKTVLGESV